MLKLYIKSVVIFKRTAVPISIFSSVPFLRSNIHRNNLKSAVLLDALLSIFDFCVTMEGSSESLSGTERVSHNILQE